MALEQIPNAFATSQRLWRTVVTARERCTSQRYSQSTPVAIQSNRLQMHQQSHNGRLHGDLIFTRLSALHTYVYGSSGNSRQQRNESGRKRLLRELRSSSEWTIIRGKALLHDCDILAPRRELSGVCRYNSERLQPVHSKSDRYN